MCDVSPLILMLSPLPPSMGLPNQKTAADPSHLDIRHGISKDSPRQAITRSAQRGRRIWCIRSGPGTFHPGIPPACPQVAICGPRLAGPLAPRQVVQRLFLARACVSWCACGHSESAMGAALAAPEWAHSEQSVRNTVSFSVRPTAAWNKGIVRKEAEVDRRYILRVRSHIVASFLLQTFSRLRTTLVAEQMLAQPDPVCLTQSAT